jgi:hypothetical protein
MSAAFQEVSYLGASLVHMYRGCDRVYFPSELLGGEGGGWDLKFLLCLFSLSFLPC